MPYIPPSPEVARAHASQQRRNQSCRRIIIELVADGRLGTDWLRKLL